MKNFESWTSKHTYTTLTGKTKNYVAWKFTSSSGKEIHGESRTEQAAKRDAKQLDR